MVHNHLQALRDEHETLEQRIHDEVIHPGSDDLEIRRLKKQKLHLKEEISHFERREEEDSRH